MQEFNDLHFNIFFILIFQNLNNIFFKFCGSI